MAVSYMLARLSRHAASESTLAMTLASNDDECRHEFGLGRLAAPVKEWGAMVLGRTPTEHCDVSVYAKWGKMGRQDHPVSANTMPRGVKATRLW